MELVARLLVPLLLFCAAQGCPELTADSCNKTLISLSDLYGGGVAGLDSESTVCVILPANSGETLEYRNASLSFGNVLIWGNNSTITCDPTDPQGDSTPSPLQFHNASMVAITELNFEGCRRPLKFKRVQTVQILSSTFGNFCCGGAIEISNSPIVCIQDSLFINDTSQGLNNVRRFSGNAGGVAIGYEYPGNLQNVTPDILISGCTFENNTANATEDRRLTVLAVLSMRIYNQRGGGMAFYFGAESYNAAIRIEDSQFINNTAQDSGGGVYMFLDGPQSFHTVDIYNTNFTGNRAMDGGGLEITHSNPDSSQNPNLISVTKCNFDGNQGKFGGGYKNIQLNDVANSNHLYMRDCTFDGNEASVGAGIYLQSVVTIEKTTLLKRIVMEDCRFSSNNGKRGVVFVIGNVVTINGTTVFYNSTGPALRILGTLVVLKGDMTFEGNRHDPEGFSGALYLSSFAQIVLHANTNITFRNNVGSEGACIVVRGQLIAAAFTRQLYNPQCFLQYEEPTEPPSSWNVSITFEGNRANVGPAVLLSDGEICLWNSSNSPFFSDSLRNTWESFMHMRGNYINGVEERTRADIQTGIFSLKLELEEADYKSAFPGKNISVRVSAMDQFNQRTSAFIGINTNESTMDTTTFEPSIVQISPQSNSANFKFLGSEDNVNTTVVLNPFFTSNPDEIVNFTLHHDVCMPGHNLTDGTCVCSPDTDIILCQDDSLLLDDGLWGASPEWCSELVTHPCPPGYCECNGIPDNDDIKEGCQLLFEKPQNICVEERRRDSQVLCGRCKDGLGVGLLTNACKYHSGHPMYYYLVPIYVIALVVSLVLLVKLGVHLPTVLRGFLFYIQIAPIAMAYFPESFNLDTDVLSCIGSTLALYSPYDFTFHRNMTSLEAYALRYCAPIIAFVVVPIVARFKRHRIKYWHGIWTIVLLMYVMSVETSISLLFCPILKCGADGRTTTRWFFDGNVECYKNEHIPLAIIALVSLVIQAFIVLFVTAIVFHKTLRKKYIKFERLERLFGVITRGIKEEYKWWPIVELGCRFIFVAAVILSSGVVVVPLILSIPIFVLQSLIHPYKSKAANYLESFLFLWLVCLLGLANTTALQDQVKDNVLRGKYGTRENGTVTEGPWWPNALLYVPVAVGFVVLVVHFVFLFKKLFVTHEDKIRKKLKMKTRESVHKLKNLSHSYSSRNKLMDVSHGMDPKVSTTVVGLDDGTDALLHTKL